MDDLFRDDKKKNTQTQARATITLMKTSGQSGNACNSSAGDLHSSREFYSGRHNDRGQFRVQQ